MAASSCSVLLLCVSVASALQAGGVAPRRRQGVVALLAPREALLEEFRRVSDGNEWITEAAAADCRFIADLLREGELEVEELEAMFRKASDGEKLSASGFVQLCEDIDDLFEAEADDDLIGDDVASLRGALVSGLPSDVMRTEFPEEDEEDDDPVVARALALVEASGDSVDADAVKEAIPGQWRLAYVSSQSFAFNEGYTGVAKTTPGGADFLGLTQRFQVKPGGALVATMVEDLETNVGNAALPVTVTGDWTVKSGTEPVTDRAFTLINVIPRSVEYGILKVEGQRVEMGWKTMRVANALEVVYIDDELRIQRGPTSWFIWTKESEDESS